MLCPEISHVVNIIFKVNVTPRRALCHRDTGTVLLSTASADKPFKRRVRPSAGQLKPELLSM